MPTGLDLVSLVNSHQAGIWRYLRALGCEPSQAEELTQETFLAVLQHPFDDYHPAATAAYLRKVARNLFVSSRRRDLRGGPVVQLGAADIDVAELDGVDADWARWADRDSGEAALVALKQCLGELTERARWALQMRFRDQETRQAMAAKLGLSEDGAKNLLQRSKQQLRSCVERKLG
jgi:RNA polymerase sigma-70 factor (ECF subfamily)